MTSFYLQFTCVPAYFTNYIVSITFGFYFFFCYASRLLIPSAVVLWAPFHLLIFLQMQGRFLPSCLCHYAFLYTIQSALPVSLTWHSCCCILTRAQHMDVLELCLWSTYFPFKRISGMFCQNPVRFWRLFLVSGMAGLELLQRFRVGLSLSPCQQWPGSCLCPLLLTPSILDVLMRLVLVQRMVD